MKILAIETSCDETAAAVTEGLSVLSSVKITQEVHSQWGGVVPSLAKRDHEANIDWVIKKALDEAGAKINENTTENRDLHIESNSDIQNSKPERDGIDAIAVTMGPGLAIALGVGIAKAKELAVRYHKPLIAVNHVEGHILSSLIDTAESVQFPAVALIVSGGHTQLVLVKNIGDYEILAESLDDDIGEALDKGARLLDLPYPGGPALETLAARGNPKHYHLPLPMQGKEANRFSYAGLKTAFSRLVENTTSQNPRSTLREEQKADLAAAYQDMVFRHLVRITEKVISAENQRWNIEDLLVGGGVVANSELRKRLDTLTDSMGMTLHYPKNMVLCTDNAAMIGVVAGYKAARGEFSDPAMVDRKPRWRVDEL